MNLQRRNTKRFRRLSRRWTNHNCKNAHLLLIWHQGGIKVTRRAEIWKTSSWISIVSLKSNNWKTAKSRESWLIKSSKRLRPHHRSTNNPKSKSRAWAKEKNKHLSIDCMTLAKRNSRLEIRQLTWRMNKALAWQLRQQLKVICIWFRAAKI